MERFAQFRAAAALGIRAAGPGGADTWQCRADLTGPEERTNDTIYSCSSCGQSAPYAAIMEDVKAYATELAQQQINAQLADIAGKTTGVTFTPGSTPQRDYRFTRPELINNATCSG